MALKNFVYIYFGTAIVFNIQFVKGILPPSCKVLSSSEAPFVVYIDNGYMYCTGVILNPLIILTAGHCIYEHNGMVRARVRAGRSDKYYAADSTEQTAKVKKALRHENYLVDPNGIQVDNDIGLLLLETPLTFNLFVQPIEWANNIDFDKSVLIYEWGSTNAFQSFGRSNYLHVKNVCLIPDKLCNDMLEKARTKCTKQVYEFCTQKGTSYGDSGGPAIQIVDNVKKLIGIHSWVKDDNINPEPVVFENVGYFSKWIKDGIRVLVNGNITENLTCIEKIV